MNQLVQWERVIFFFRGSLVLILFEGWNLKKALQQNQIPKAHRDFAPEK